MLITKENFAQANFANDERSVIECLIQDGPENEYIPLSIEVDENNELFKELMALTTLDEIEKTTLQLIQDQRDAIEAYHIQLIEEGKAQGKAEKAYDDDSYTQVLKAVVGAEPTNPDHLFKTKLEAFEIEQIIDAPVEIKEAIRTTETQFDVIKTVKEYLDSL